MKEVSSHSKSKWYLKFQLLLLSVLSIGNIICQKTWNLFAPSIVAASSNDRGIEFKAP